MSNKSRGTSYEYKAKYELQREGFLVIRAGSSIGVFDLVGFSPVTGEAIFLQIKSSKSKYWHSIHKKTRLEFQNMSKLVKKDSLVRLEFWVRHARKWHKFRYYERAEELV